MIELREDFQGWPIYGLTLREVLKELGFETKDGLFSISDDSEILDAYPRLLEDDGMGYGVDEQFLTVGDDYVYDTEIDTLKRNYKPLAEGELIPDIESYEKVPVSVKCFNVFRENPTRDRYVNHLNESLNNSNKKESEN